MKVNNSKVPGEVYDKYILEATIGGVPFIAALEINKATYGALDKKDANTLIESQLWQRLMYTIENQLRNTAYANH